MSLDTKSFEELRDMEYRQRLVVNRLQSDLYAEVDPAEIQSLNDELMDAQDDLHAIEEALAEFEPVDDKPPEARGESTAPGRPTEVLPWPEWWPAAELSRSRVGGSARVSTGPGAPGAASRGGTHGGEPRRP